MNVLLVALFIYLGIFLLGWYMLIRSVVWPDHSDNKNMDDYLLQFQEKDNGEWPSDTWRDARTGTMDELSNYKEQESDHGNNRIRWRMVKVVSLPLD